MPRLIVTHGSANGKGIQNLTIADNAAVYPAAISDEAASAV
jgi:hypothetical protein